MWQAAIFVSSNEREFTTHGRCEVTWQRQKALSLCVVKSLVKRTHHFNRKHLTTLLDRVVRCCEGDGQTRATAYNIQKCRNANMAVFHLIQPYPTSFNMSQYVATGCPNVSNTLFSTMLRWNVAFVRPGLYTTYLPVSLRDASVLLVALYYNLNSFNQTDNFR